MKIKNAWIVFAVTLLVALFTRIYQVLFLVEPDTGFYTDGSRTTVIISAALVVGILLMMAMCLLDKREKTGYRPIQSTSAAVTGTIAGLGISLQYAISLFTEDGLQNQISSIVLSVIGIMAGIVLIMTAYDFSIGRNIFEQIPLLALVPPIWGCACLVSLFITYVAVVNISENIYDAFTVIFLLLFLFTQAKMLARIEDEKSGKMIYVFGLPAALLSLVTGIPGTLVLFGGISRTSSFPAGLYPVNILLALYVIAFLFAVPRAQKAVPVQSSPTEETNAETEETAEKDTDSSTQESCLEYLGKAYQSKEQFVERTKSPFQQILNKNC